jgi:hypothetical protein
VKFIHYKEGYKYQLSEDYVGETGIIPPAPVLTHFIALSAEGRLSVKADYAWDGPSGPTIDTANFMRGSLEHDAFYQLMREGHLPPDYRIRADVRLRQVCLEDGMHTLRAWWVYHGVRMGGAGAIEPRRNEILTAP